MPSLLPFFLRGLAVACFLSGASATAAEGAAGQLIVAVAPDQGSHRGVLRRFEKQPDGSWRPVGASIPVLFGKRGLAWGLGLHEPQPGPQKVENDGRTPAGRFKVGMILGNEPHPPQGSQGWPYHPKTPNDAWVGDSSVPQYYNHLFTLKPGQTPPEWFDKEKFKLKDDTYDWLVLIEHNYPKSVPGKGCAIFFHKRRGPDKATIGCTSMAPDDLQILMRWLNPKKGAEYVVLTEEDYRRFERPWALPLLRQVKED
jgi:L,D-peptidoglycan transpeptidase YkuD (ErfK/YbiS/YcfS/YnhG family)